MVTRAEPEPNDVRTRALAAATRLFAGRGFDGTTIQLIADEVGVSKPAVLHHFPSKEDLRRAVLDAILQHWRDVLPRLLLAATASHDRFDAVFGELHRFFASDPNRARLVARELFDRPGEVKKMLRGAVRPWIGAVAAYVKEGQAHGRHWEDVDAEAYVVHIMQLVVCATAAADVCGVAVDPDGDPSERYDKELARIARASLFKPGKSERSTKTTKTGDTMASYFTDNEDLRFYLSPRGIDWGQLVEITEYGYRTKDGFKGVPEALEFYTQVAEMAGELAADEVGSRAARIDREETHLVNGEAVPGKAMTEIFDRIKAADMHRLCLPRELGGLNAPILLYFVIAEMLARGDVSVMTHHSFHGGMAMAMLVYSLNEGTTELDLENAAIKKTRFSAEMDEIARGEAWGCMDITEPNAGSDMAALRTVGEQDANGDWFVTGQKIFITSGHGKYHFVVARTEEVKAGTAADDAFAGLGGLSMFLVKTYADQPDGTRKRFVTLDRVEEKLGHHGSVTAALSFDRAPAKLIGKRGEGFKYMLVLMNNARLGVGFESIGLCEASWRMARAYAEERRSMGKVIARHEMIADYLDEMQTDVLGLRALAVTAAFHEEMAQKVAILQRFAAVAKPGEKEKLDRALPEHRAKARRATPLLKYLAAEKAVEMARRCVQIHGGVGYTKDYGAEKLLRDAMVMPIYEGTSQIQSLMAMKDALLGIIKKPGAFVTRVAQAKWRAVSARDPLERRVAKIQSLSLGAQQHLATRTATGKLRALSDVPVAEWKRELTGAWDPKRDFALAMLHAERLTKLMADEQIVEILFDQAKANPERRPILERYLDRAEIRDKALYEEITTTGARILASIAPEKTPEPLSSAAE